MLSYIAAVVMVLMILFTLFSFLNYLSKLKPEYYSIQPVKIGIMIFTYFILIVVQFAMLIHQINLIINT